MSERTVKIIITVCLLGALIFGILAAHSYLNIKFYEHSEQQIEKTDT